MPEQPPPGPVAGAAAYLLVLLLALLVTLWGAFLLPLRVGGHLVPVSLLLVSVGTLVLGAAGGRLRGRAGAAGPGLLWLAVALTLGSQRAEGDIVIARGGVGVGYLLLGSVGSALAVALTGTQRASPRDRDSR